MTASLVMKPHIQGQPDLNDCNALIQAQLCTLLSLNLFHPHQRAQPSRENVLQEHLVQRCTTEDTVSKLNSSADFKRRKYLQHINTSTTWLCQEKRRRSI